MTHFWGGEDNAFGVWDDVFGSLDHGVTHFWGSVPRTVILEDRRQYPSVVISLETWDLTSLFVIPVATGISFD